MHQRITNGTSKATFKRRLRGTSSNAVKALDNPNESYVKFIETITQIYDDCSPKTKFKIKSNNKANQWIAKGIAKSYKKFLNNSSIQTENEDEGLQKSFWNSNYKI